MNNHHTIISSDAGTPAVATSCRQPAELSQHLIDLVGADHPLLADLAAISSFYAPDPDAPDFKGHPVASAISSSMSARCPLGEGATLTVAAAGDAGAGSASYPVSNTGGNSDDRGDLVYPVHVDYLTFTVSGFHFDGDVGKASACLERWTGGLFKIGGSTDRKFSGYKDCYLICPSRGGESPFLGWVGVSDASDNMRGWWCFSLPGKATENVINWSALVSDMWDMGGRITRVDLALDDFDGVHPLLECESLYDAGAFQSNKGGRPPSAHTRKCKLGLSGDTLYVGSRESGKQMRCYEKGKQLGDSGSPWVRYEGELLRKDKNIPWDVLLFPAQYLKGMYETAFSWMPASPIHLAALKEKSRITLERAKKWLKQQGGRLICYLREVVHMDVADIVCELSAKPGRYPLRLFDAARHAELAWPD